MGFLKLAFLLLVCLHMCTSSTSDDESHESADASVQLNDDVLGLIVFKSHLEDPSSYLQSWNEEDNSPCSWKFIQCNPKTGRVSQLLLDGLGLSGKLGRGLEKLQHLKVLSLSYNNISGDITPHLALITSLETLNLTRNSLSGTIPSSLLANNNITFLDLSHNSLSGPLPDDNHLFRNCPSLRHLSLAANILQGSISTTLLTNCYSLNHLNLSRNHFSGEPPSGIWSLKRLRTLDLSVNTFSGSIPQGVILGLQNLKEIVLQGNQFSGQLPQDIGLCPHLSRLDFSSNFFSGALPDSLSTLKSISFISLSNNMFTGEFPLWFSNITTLEYVDFSNNGLTGTLPPSIGDLKSLKYLSLSNNKLTGNIPTSLPYCEKLAVIRLGGNSFNGSIPEGLFELGLEEVDFSGNGFMGSIPPGSSKLFESLRVLDLSNNNLTGNIGGEMGIFANLRYLNLSWNNLQSNMPPEIGYLQSLKELDLRNSDLRGSIPGDICESGSLDILQLDGNSLSGTIPEEIGNCSSLYLLSLSNNNLSGSIPKSISKLNKLEILKLEWNKLSGEIPRELGKIESLVAVNVSYNRLVGRIPEEGVFPSLDQSALQGNLGICSPLLKGPCKMNVPKPLVLDPDAYYKHRQINESSTTSRDNHRMFLSVSSIIAITAAFLIAFGVIAISLLNVSARRRLAFVDTALESMCSSTSSKSASLATGKLILFDSRSSSPDWVINPESLLQKDSEIGKGVFGTVYKVLLGAHDQGRIVAVKKLVTSNIIQNPGDFEREVGVLGKARHPNLISLEGYYWTPQLQLLVSEYAPNGSLQTNLHERLPCAPLVSWVHRFKIIFGTAKGLAHLHHSFRPPIIHYNIKPSNILLDENYNPKISDFGLARLVTKLDKHVMSNRFQNALGYVAPELTCQSLRVNEKCDIYGFGVLILELVTGRRPVEYGEDNVVILSDHVRILLEEGNVLECVDPSMGDFPEDEVFPVLKLALVCTSQIPSSRPSMAEVVQILQVIKTPLPQRRNTL
ncbi:hypothetical protein LWI28_002659 [Acer negundo]|uniref:Protein kinase domain-containing protein n=1 Tax=Acer negundo TaxID=4023 RepID=A0AAD5JC73_ACENE|nr:hypothetical protein LWI28_002659 [Acer negundo]